MVSLLKGLLAARRIFSHPSSVQVYLAAGTFPDMPIARYLPKGGYTTPHWAPVTLSTTPFPMPIGGKPRPLAAGAMSAGWMGW